MFPAPPQEIDSNRHTDLIYGIPWLSQPQELGRAAHWLIELAYPLYGFASTPERRRYWHDLPLRRAAKLFGAVFFVLAGVPFFIDALSSQSYPLIALIVISVVTGVLHVLVIVSELRRPRLMVLPMLAVVAVYLSLAKLPKISEPPPVREQRIVLDATCLMVAMLLGYRLFLNFANTEGIAHIQLETELALAHRLQKTLVPTFSYHGMGSEAYGRTIPSAEVGGDLVDLVADTQGVFAYLADVSGHGIPAGVLMGMVKSSVRQALLARFSMQLCSIASIPSFPPLKSLTCLSPLLLCASTLQILRSSRSRDIRRSYISASPLNASAVVP